MLKALKNTLKGVKKKIDLYQTDLQILVVLLFFVFLAFFGDLGRDG